MIKPSKAILIATLLAATRERRHRRHESALRAKAQQAVDAGIKFLRSKQAANGSVLNSTGLTALSLTSILQNPAGAGKVDKTVIDKYANFIASKANADGSIVEQQHDQSYNTAVAITALAATKDPKYAPLVTAGQKYIVRRRSANPAASRRSTAGMAAWAMAATTAGRVEPLHRDRGAAADLVRPK